MTTFDTDIIIRGCATDARRPFALARADRRVLLAALCALMAFRVLLMCWLPVTDPTEARYAEIARKMVETGDWITPQFDYDVPFWGKPPLHTWLSALGMKAFGVGVFGARVFIFLSGLTVLGLCGAFMRRRAGTDQAMVAMAVLFSSILFFGASAFVMTDMVMVLGTTLSMVAFHTCVTGRSTTPLWGHLFFLGLAIGLLAKGPVAVVLTVMPIGAWILVGRRWSLFSALPWMSGGLLLLALSLPWYIAAELKTPGFLQYFIVGEHVERFTVPGWQGDLYGSGHARAKGLIWLYWLGAFLPWTPFAIWLLSRPGKVAEAVRADESGWYSYLLLWAAAPMVLFTPAANILAAYVLPGFPASVLLLVSLWGAVQGAPGGGTRTLFGIGIGSVIALFLVVTGLAHAAPKALNLQSQHALVKHADEIDPDMKLTFWGGRSYSGEFYTGGRAGATADASELGALALNTARDAVAVRADSLDVVADILGETFEPAGDFGRYMLLVEAPSMGE